MMELIIIITMGFARLISIIAIYLIFLFSFILMVIIIDYKSYIFHL